MARSPLAVIPTFSIGAFTPIRGITRRTGNATVEVGAGVGVAMIEVATKVGNGFWVTVGDGLGVSAPL